MNENYRTLGDYIEIVDERNKGLAIDNLLGVSIAKKFIPSIANIVGTDLSNYKIVRTSQFAYGPVTSRNGEKISIAFLDGDDCIISSSYTVFRVIKENELDPEYLMLWFSRPEFDRYTRYKSHGSVREIFDWNEMCMVELPVPDIDKQRNIVKAYKTITDRIALKQKINDNLEQQILSIFTEKFGAVIKSGTDFPPNWTKDEAQNIYDITIGKTPPRERLDCFTNNDSDIKWVSISDMGSNGMYILRTSECLTESSVTEFNVKTIPANTVIYSFKMTNGRTAITTEECTTNEAIAHFKTNNIDLTYYAYCYLSTFRFSDLGSTSSITEAVNSKIIKAMPFYIPPEKELSLFCNQIKPLFEAIKLNSLELLNLNAAASNFLALLSR
jgi:hypothetical protein